MKKVNKQLYLLRQAGVEKLGRAEKTSQELPEHLHEAQRSVDCLQKGCSNVSKKMQACNQSTGVDYEKRLKKLPQTAVAASLTDSALEMGDSPFGQVAAYCSEAMERIAFQRATYEVISEQEVICPMRNFVETDGHDLSKLYKKLEKSRLELDSTRPRLHKAEKKSSMEEMRAIQTQLEDAEAKFGSLRNQYQVDLLTTASCELDMAGYLVKHMELMITYHKECLSRLQEVLPKMKTVVDTTAYRRLFGCPLETHLAVTNREISVVLEVCCSALLADLDTEGLFRIAGAGSEVKKLKAHFDYGIIDLADSSPHVIAGALKLYLRKLPEPIMTSSRHEAWRSIGTTQDRDARLQSLHQYVHDLPKINYDNLKYLMVFLRRLADRQSVNKMGASNIAIVIAPNLMWPPRSPGDEDVGVGSISDSQTLARLVEDMIEYNDYIFPEGATLESSMLSRTEDTSSSRKVDSPTAVDSPLTSAASTPTGAAPAFKPRPAAPVAVPRPRAASSSASVSESKPAIAPKLKPASKSGKAPAPRPPGAAPARPTSPPSNLPS